MFYDEILLVWYAEGMANSVDPDQTAPWVCTVCTNLCVPKLRTFVLYTILLPKITFSECS